jgi:hypothetical protein
MADSLLVGSINDLLHLAKPLRNIVPTLLREMPILPVWVGRLFRSFRLLPNYWFVLDKHNQTI